MSEDQCGDETCTEEHGDEPDPGVKARAEKRMADEGIPAGMDSESFAIYEASLHYRNGQR